MGYLDHSEEKCILGQELVNYWKIHNAPIGFEDEATRALKEYYCPRCEELAFCHNKKYFKKDKANYSA